MGKSRALPEPPRGLTFEDVWAALMEDREERKKYAREWRKEAKEAWKISRETDKKIGKLGDRFGEMIEHKVMPALVKKFRELGFVFTEAGPRRIIDDEKNKVFAEIDIILENGDKVMVVEVKSKPNTKDIKEHIKRMEIVQTRARMKNDSRIFLGAIAGMVMDKSIKTFVLKNGFYLIEPSGEDFFITVPEGEYSPREW